MSKRLKLICIILIVLLMFIGGYSAYRYGNKLKYLERVLDISLEHMTEDTEGKIQAFVFSPDFIQLKVKIKKGSENEIRNSLSSKYREMPEEGVTRILDKETTNLYKEYTNEIKGSKIEAVYLTWVYDKMCHKPLCIFVTSQNNEMILYFLDDR